MMIKDLEMSKELASEELSDVRGGANTLVQTSVQETPVGALGGGVGSPVFINSAPVNTQVGQIDDNDLRLDIGTKTANIAQSLGVLVLQ